MPTGQLEQFNCDGCGKQYRWKPELAGKRVKCKCGHTMTVPQPPPPPAESADFNDDPFADALSAMAEAEHTGATAVHEDLPRCPSCASEMAAGATVCTQCGYNVNTGKVAGAGKKARKGAVPMGVGSADGGVIAMAPSPVAAAAATKRSGPTPLAYAGMPVRSSRASANAGDNNIGHAGTDLFLPLGLFLLGIGLTFCEAWFGRGISEVGFALAFTAFTVLINLVFVFIGIMMAVRILSLGLGPLGPALLKIAAISVLPGAVAGMLLHVVGDAGYMLCWVVNLILIYAMFMGMLDLDFTETAICGVFIWMIRTWVVYGLVFALLHGMGLSSAGGKGSAAMIAAMSGPSGSKLKSPKPAKPKVTAAQLDARATAALAQPGATEARAWVAVKEPGISREIPRFADIPAAEAIDHLYANGAKQIMITRTASPAGQLRVRQLVITLPEDKDGRLGYFSWGQAITHEFSGTTQPDVGQKYLLVDFDGKYAPGEEPIDESDDSGDGDTAPGL